MILQDVINKIKKVINRIDFDHHFNWFIQKFNLIDKSKELNDHKVGFFHPIKPKKGDIYLIEFGQNVGNELSDNHLGIIIQNSSKNNVSNTVVVIPISSSKRLYDTHEKILESDIQVGRLDKLPSKAKAEQITCIDKARLIHKVGEVTPDFIKRLEKRILLNLDIK